MTVLTRGPLPARVYWTRRLMVLGTAALLVFGLARILPGGDGSRAPEQAVQVAATPSASGRSLPVVRETRPPERGPRAAGKGKKVESEPVLVEPEGVCAAEDIAVAPRTERAVAGRPVLLVLELRTVTSAACTWQVSPETLTVKVTSGKDDIWSSRDCPRAVPTRSVVVRQAASTKVGVRWSGRRSDDECSRFTEWALPGWYHVAAAALAGEPSDLQFELERPRREVVTKTVQAKPDQQRDDREDGAGRDGGEREREDGARKDGDRKQDPPKHR